MITHAIIAFNKIENANAINMLYASVIFFISLTSDKNTICKEFNHLTLKVIRPFPHKFVVRYISTVFKGTQYINRTRTIFRHLFDSEFRHQLAESITANAVIAIVDNHELKSTYTQTNRTKTYLDTSGIDKLNRSANVVHCLITLLFRLTKVYMNTLLMSRLFYKNFTSSSTFYHPNRCNMKENQTYPPQILPF